MVSIILYHCVLCVALLMDMFVNFWLNNSQYVWVWLLFCCSSCTVTTHCLSTGRHTPSQFHCIPLNRQSYIPEEA